MIVDPLPCQMLVEQATDWLEGDMPTAERKEIELHLVTCAGCLAYVEQLRQTRRAMTHLDEARLDGDEGGPPPAQVRSNLLAMFRRRTAGDA